MARIVETPGITLDEILRKTIEIIPDSWQYPEAARAKMTIGDRVFVSSDFQPTDWVQSVDLIVGGEKAGTIDVFYIEEKPQANEGPFLKGERELLDAVAERLGRIAERKMAEVELIRTNEELRRSEERYRALAESSDDMIMLMDENTRCYYVNNAVVRMIGMRLKNIIGKTANEFLHPDVAAMIKRNVRETMETLKTRRVEELISSPGRSVWMDTMLTPIVSDAGDQLVLVVARDITAKKETEAALKRGEEQFRTLVENTTDCISRLDTEGRFQFLNSAGLRMLGATSVEQVRGTRYIDRVAPESRVIFEKHMDTALKGEVARWQFGRETAIGMKYFESVMTPQVENDETVSVIVISMDVTERKNYQDRLEYLAAHDPMTGLYNYGAFYDIIKYESDKIDRYGGILSVILIDIDHFKRVNDEYGHQTGDIVLTETAKLISKTCRTVDSVARYGGEEFIVLEPETGATEAERSAERIRRAIESNKVYMGSGQTVAVRVSAGTASFPQDGRSPTEIVKCADRALYTAKDSGRNQVRRYAA